MGIEPKEQKSVISAIKKAEKKTSAEIFAVLAEQSDDYRFIAYAFLALWTFLVSSVLVLLLQWFEIDIPLSIFIWSQLLAFMFSMLIIKLWPHAAILMTPERIAHERSHNNAVKQFLAHGIHNTKGRNGILVFVSVKEQYAEILVDSAIEEKIGREFFLESVEQLVKDCENKKIAQGYQTAIESISQKLSSSFPHSKNDKNELEDKLVII